MGPRRPKSARSCSEASSRPSRSTTPASEPSNQPSVRFAEPVIEELPPNYDPEVDMKLLFSYLHHCSAPDDVQLALPRILEAMRQSDYAEYEARQAQHTPTPAPPTPPPPPFPIDLIREIVHTEVEKILKEVKASFADLPAPAPAPASGSGPAAPRSYAEAATAQGRPYTAPGELRVHPRTMREVTFRVPTNPKALALTSAQIVRKTNTAVGSAAILAARQLPSRDVVLSFDSESSKD